MTSNKSDNKHWEDPKDFGLPFVEINPLPSALNMAEKKISPPKKEGNDESLPDFSSQVIYSGEEKKHDSKPNNPKKNQAWIWISLVIVFILLGVIYTQIQKNSLNNLNKKEQNLAEIKSDPIVPVTIDQTDSVTIQKTATEQNLLDSTELNQAVDQEIQFDNDSKLSSNIEIVRIATRLENPRYFIVVASLSRESLAIVEAEKYVSRGEIIYLILPHENASNYRLSIGFFDSLKDASNELERVKANYTETLWILKY